MIGDEDDTIRGKVTFNRVTTSIEKVYSGYRILIRYWSSEHEESKVEASRKTFPTAQLANDVATQIAYDIREKLG